MSAKRGMVFGVFDGLHEGHKYFLSEAAKLCEELLVVVAPENAVEILKGRPPQHAYKERAEAIAALNSSFRLVEGDAALGEWNVLKIHKPDIVILGHDQHKLERELSLLTISYTFVPAHKPETYKSSLLRTGS